MLPALARYQVKKPDEEGPHHYIWGNMRLFICAPRGLKALQSKEKETSLYKWAPKEHFTTGNFSMMWIAFGTYTVVPHIERIVGNSVNTCYYKNVLMLNSVYWSLCCLLLHMLLGSFISFEFLPAPNKVLTHPIALNIPQISIFLAMESSPAFHTL